ncbi:MAG: helix-turn-helix transcriptional regulator [Actinomycetota bacterium]
MKKAEQVSMVPRLMSVAELSEALQVPAETIYQWRHRGLGPKPIRLGRHLRFDPADVARWLEGRKAASASSSGG